MDPMSQTLKLTQAEKKLFTSLPAALKEGWVVEEEIGICYEHPMQIRMRMHMSSLKKYPYFKEFATSVDAGKSVDAFLLLKNLPPELIPEVFFVIGARGLTFMIGDVLRGVNSDDDLKTIAAWSQVRSEILEANASIS